MSKNDILREIMILRLSSKQERNKSYSKRKFASDVGISSGSLIDFLNSKREFNEKTINSISEKIMLSEKELLQIKDAPVFKDERSDPYSEFKIYLSDKGLVELNNSLKKFLRRCKKIEQKSPGEIHLKLDFLLLDMQEKIKKENQHTQGV